MGDSSARPIRLGCRTLHSSVGRERISFGNLLGTLGDQLCPRATAVSTRWSSPIGLHLSGCPFASNSDHLTGHGADEISTGLDSNTTFQICKGLKNFTHVMQASVLGRVLS